SSSMGIICYASHIICSPEDTVPETGYRYPRKARHDTAERVAHAGARGRDRRMKLTIFAATGGVGRHLVGQAIAAGHDVPAEARARRADLATAQPAALATAVGGADAVLSALGPRSKAEYGIAATGTRAIAGAMQAAGVRRLVVVSAAPVGTIATPRRPRPP